MNMPIKNTDKNQELFLALKNSIYPGAKDESITLVISYCKHLNLDPMLKPIHIVNMKVKDSKTGHYSSRDVLMPGIGLYRTIAYRTDRYVGMSEPKLGPDITENLGGIEITYPQWCLILIKTMVGGTVATFPSLGSVVN